MEHIKSTAEAALKKLATGSMNSEEKPLNEMACLPDAWVIALFKRFQARYLHKWTSAIEGIEETVIHEWGQVLAGLTGEDIKRGLDSLKSEWPPTAYEFRDMCKKPVTPFDGAHKCLPKPPVDPELVDDYMQMMRDSVNN